MVFNSGMDPKAVVKKVQLGTPDIQTPGLTKLRWR
jgi:hypothetical protein